LIYCIGLRSPQNDTQENNLDLGDPCVELSPASQLCVLSQIGDMGESVRKEKQVKEEEYQHIVGNNSQSRLSKFSNTQRAFFAQNKSYSTKRGRSNIYSSLINPSKSKSVENYSKKITAELDGWETCSGMEIKLFSPILCHLLQFICICQRFF